MFFFFDRVCVCVCEGGGGGLITIEGLIGKAT